MREIKFRAWNTGIKEMFYFDLFTVSNEIHLRKQNMIMQYTGLKDKNGKEIYEDDIIEQVTNVIVMGKTTKREKITRRIVTFKNGLFAVRNKKGNIMWCLNFKDELYVPEPYVVGNIYENPELIGK